MIKIYTITSALHDAQSIDAATREFLGQMTFDFQFRGADFSDYGSAALSLIYVRTGGTENVFLQLLPQLLRQSSQPFYLLTSGKSNSLAASMEILSYLRSHEMQGEILHGSTQYLCDRIAILAKVSEARKVLNGTRLAVVGKPSDWLIASSYDAVQVKHCLGIELLDISLDDIISTVLAQGEWSDDTSYFPVAERIYDALHQMTVVHRLNGFTIRCFDLLTALHNTGCLALARLNSQGFVAGCEGDVPAMLTMAIVRSLTGVSGFQANPSVVDVETGQLLLAHCTIPLDMCSRYEYDTHFESGIGVATRGTVSEGPVTIVKVSGDIRRCFVEEGMLLSNERRSDLCRTQLLVKLDTPSAANYFLTNPIGNHHIVVPGRWKSAVTELLDSMAWKCRT